VRWMWTFMPRGVRQALARQFAPSHALTGLARADGAGGFEDFAYHGLKRDAVPACSLSGLYVGTFGMPAVVAWPVPASTVATLEAGSWQLNNFAVPVGWQLPVGLCIFSPKSWCGKCTDQRVDVTRAPSRRGSSAAFSRALGTGTISPC